MPLVEKLDKRTKKAKEILKRIEFSENQRKEREKQKRRFEAVNNYPAEIIAFTYAFGESIHVIDASKYHLRENDDVSFVTEPGPWWRNPHKRGEFLSLNS